MSPVARFRLAALLSALFAAHAGAAASGAPAPRSGSADVDAAYESMQRFLAGRASAMAPLRAESRRDRDTSSVEAFTASARPRRERLRALLGVPPQCKGGGKLESRARIAAPDGLTIERVQIRSCGGALLQSGLLGYGAVAKGPAPLVVVLHGTAASPERAFGLDDPKAYQAREYHHRVAARLAEAGYLVYVPYLVTERRDDPQTGFNRLRNEIDLRATAGGYRLTGLEIGQIMAAPGALRATGLARPGAVGVYGISLGGMLAYYYAALDPRVTAVVVSQWIEDRDRKLMGEVEDDPLWRHAAAGHAVTPGLLPQFDDAAVAALIVPRALFIEVGREDARARTAPAVYDEIKSVYRALRLPRVAACLELAPGGHDVVLNGARLFLDRWLRNASDPKLAEFCR
jgi:predicted dienelactone hydrolase